MRNEFKYKIWDLPSYIMELESTTTSGLTEDELEDVSGGIVNRKLTASVLASLSVLAGTANLTKSNVSATPTTSVSQKVEQSQTIDSEVTKEQSIEDINYVLKVIKDNHVSAVEKMPDEVTAQAKIEIGNLKDKVSVVEEWRIVSRILAKLHDAHTKVLTPQFLNKRLPFDTEYEHGKFICRSEDFKGCEITAINDIPISDLYKTFQAHFSYEIEEWTEHHFFEAPSDFIPEWKLALCGIDTSKPIKISFSTKLGIRSKIFKMVEIAKPNADSEHWISYEIDEKNSLGIFKLNRCRKNDEYWKTLSDFLREVSNKKIKNIAIDLRKNVGGNSMAGVMFAMALKGRSELKDCGYVSREGDVLLKGGRTIRDKEYIEEFRNDFFGENYDKNVLFDGNVFVLTSHQTFSSGMNFAQIFQDNNLGTIVGEVPGNSPESFGDVATSKDSHGKRTIAPPKMPNSQLTFTATFKKFSRIDKSKDGTRLIPDVQVPAKEALNKVYEIIDEVKK